MNRTLIAALALAAVPQAVAPAQAPEAPTEVLGVPGPATEVVLDYCAAVRGVLNDDQGGPLHPPGLRMAAALGDVRESIQRNLDAKTGGVPSRS